MLIKIFKNYQKILRFNKVTINRKFYCAKFDSKIYIINIIYIQKKKIKIFINIY